MIVAANRTFDRKSARPIGLAAREGLRFQKKVDKALRSVLTAPGFTIETTPWFRYRMDDGLDYSCSPDILITDREEGFIAIVEVKLSWVPNVLEKLRRVYCPVVQEVLKLPTKPLVIAKNSSPDAPIANSRLMFALMSATPFLLWRGDSPIVL